MAKVKLTPILEQFRGQMGDLVFKHYGDEVIVGRKPNPFGYPTYRSPIGASGAFPLGSAVRAAGDG